MSMSVKIGRSGIAGGIRFGFRFHGFFGFDLLLDQSCQLLSFLERDHDSLSPGVVSGEFGGVQGGVEDGVDLLLRHSNRIQL